MQPSEVDRLSTYEFREYISLLKDTIKNKKEYDLELAKLGALKFL